MIIAIANEQVNSGKSILAENFAALCAYAGRNVLLIDSTSQRKSFLWSIKRGAAGIMPKVPVRAIGGKGLQPELENISLRYKDIVIDTEGRDSLASRSALIAAQVVVIPVHAQAIDLRRQGILIRRIEEARAFNRHLRVLVIISRAEHNISPEDIQTVESFVEKIPSAVLSKTIIHEEAALFEAFQEGLSVPECTSPDNPAVVEMLSIYREIFECEKRQLSYA
jgi:chromosome partitioning protein